MIAAYRPPIHGAIKRRGSGTAGRLGKRGPRNLFTLCFALAQAKTTRSTFAADLPPIKCKSAPTFLSGRLLDRSKSDRISACRSKTVLSDRYRGRHNKIRLLGHGVSRSTRTSNANVRRESTCELHFLNSLSQPESSYKRYFSRVSKRVLHNVPPYTISSQ